MSPAFVAGVLCCLPTPSAAETVYVQLRSTEEVPSISSTARGAFSARISNGGGQLTYVLRYSGLQSEARQAHIHFGQRGVNGGVSVFLCQTAANPDPAGLAPTCPASGSVSGLLTSSNVIGPAGQGLSPGEFAELVAAIRAGVAYVNVHSTTFPGGELRGQLNAFRNFFVH
ncbi:CHRD domain-containing protein [Montanilutibacter psychrotolerans]|uniref:CHRD domain-containing protein n=1 Tax=Montanilutibacter psychrotolerans TaxID=1327343 RepID=UPI001680FD89|nr:CHRD domain-containing protein [Lysobacter psychrotolerans]